MIYERGFDKVPIEVGSGGDSVIARKTSESGQEYLSYNSAYRHIHVSLSDSKLVNGGASTTTVTIKVVDGIEVARGTEPVDATVLDYDGDVTISVDGNETTKTLTNGSVSFDLTTDKPAGSEIEIVAESLADHPAESDSTTIEVVSS